MSEDVQSSLSFDDVLIRPNYSSVLPSEVEISSYLTPSILLHCPVMSSAMDTVTEARMAIAVAKSGGIGCIHKNLSPEVQASEVRRVKKYSSGIVKDPITLKPSNTLYDVATISEKYGISSFPVVDDSSKVVGILTNRDTRFTSDQSTKVESLMTKNPVTLQHKFTKTQAIEIFQRHKIEKIIVVDQDHRCIGLLTAKDTQAAMRLSTSSKDSNGQLLVSAAIGTGPGGITRAEHLIDAGVDLIVIDTAHGHSKLVIETIKSIKSRWKGMQIIAGNVATREAVRDLARAGADAVKVGIGPGSICTTRIVTGVGVPQLSAIIECAKEAKKQGITIIADGGIRNSGDMAKAIAGGASCIMVGGALAGTDESPGEIVYHSGVPHKEYRGMGSISAMALGSAERYFQSSTGPKAKLVPEGVEGVVPYKGPVSSILYQLCGGLKSAMGYTGCKTISELRSGGAQFLKITTTTLRESHPHNILITKESPNYTN